MNFKKILSGVLAVMMTVTAVSLTAAISNAAEGDELVIHYSKIQKGNVDHKDRAVIDPAFKDADKGEVVKIAPIVDTAEKGAVNVDGYGISGLKIDVTKYNYLTVEYKFVSDFEADVRAYVRFLPNGGILKKDAGIESNETLKTNEWSTLTFNFGSQVKPLVAEGKQFIGQLHFFPFGQQLTPSTFKEGDHILIRNWTFSVDNPNGDVYYNISFESGDNNAKGTAPTPIKARYDDEIVLPEIPFTSENKTAGGWIMDSGMTVYQPGDTYKMSVEKDMRFSVIWEEDFVAQSIVELPMNNYINGICNHVDTAFLEMNGKCDDYTVVTVTPNPISEKDAAINLDGWSYTGANINVEAYKTIFILYKYVSDKPVSGKANLNIMTSNVFAKATNMTSREDIVANRWAVVSFDLTAAVPNVKQGIDPIIRQLHYYPLGGNKVSTVSADDRVYVAKMFVTPVESDKVAVHEAFMNGYADGTFGVSGNMTRAEACTIVARLTAGDDASVPTDKTTAFADVAKDQWYHKYISYVESLGYLKSYSGNFEPNKAITRAEFVELVYNMGLLSDNGKNGTFTDVSADHPKASVVAAAGKAGLVNGYANGDGTFSFKPDATITRAEVVKVINNAYGKAPNAENMYESAKGKFSDVTPDHWAYADILDAATGHISCFNKEGKEVWITLTGANSVAEDFSPDYEAGKAKLAESLATMEKRIVEIRGTESTKFDIKGKTYYVSSSLGDDSNDGKSEAKPFKTAAKAKQVAKYGDLVLFKRGDMWRERWAANSGVTYSAYGTGEKPIFNGNLLGDAADASLWTLVEGTNNIWKYAKPTADVGNIILNDGAKGTIEKIVPKIENNQLTINGVPFDPATSFAKDLHFISTYKTLDPNNPSIKEATGTLYVRCDEGNPGEVYDSIEIAYYGSLISVPSDVTMDNIHIRYSGSHGFGMGTVKNVKFTNLEVGYIGGTSQYYKNGSMTRFGNGIEVYGGCDNFVIDNCYVYQCYDAGITHQISTGGTNDVIEQNVKFINNVIDKCIYNIEYFMGKGDSENVVRILRNIEYSGNILARSGYGWGMSPSRAASIKGWDHFNRSENFKIMNNTFILDRSNACDLGASLKAWLPAFSNNTYIQIYGNRFTRVSAQYNFTGAAADALKTIGEEDGKLYYVPADIEIG